MPTGWALFGYVILAWIVLSIVGGLVLFGVLQLRWWLHARRPSNVIPLPDRSNVRKITRQDVGA